jgi:chromosome partitioning protein
MIHILRETNTPGVIVLNQGRPSSRTNQKAISVLKQYGLQVCSVPIMCRAALADSLADGRAVVALEPAGKAASEIIRSWAWIMRQLRLEVTQRVLAAPEQGGIRTVPGT